VCLNVQQLLCTKVLGTIGSKPAVTLRYLCGQSTLNYEGAPVVLCWQS
jgi:hypothetical protein